MFRSSVFLAATLFLLAAKFSAAQDTILASEILKVWEKTAIRNARIQFEEINRRFLAAEEIETESTKLVTLVDGNFYYAQGSGMRLKYNDPQRGEYNLFRGQGKSIHDHKKTPPASVSLDNERETMIESLAVTDAFRLYLDPSKSRYGDRLREVADTKLRITRDKSGNERVEIEHKKKLTLSKEYDWRPVRISQAKEDTGHPLYSFQFERGEQDRLLLRSCVFAISIESTGHPTHSCEWTISSQESDVVKDADIDLPFPSPALVHDNTVVPNKEYFLRKDGSKTPYSSKEHYKILDEIKAENAKAPKK